MKDLPKNIRQIGNVSDSTKVYIEDYVDTYINQLRHKEEKEIQGVFFVGEIIKENAEEYYLISGALLMQGIKMDGNSIIVEKDTWKLACKDAKESFDGKNIIGWALIKENIEAKPTAQMCKIDEKFFMKKNRILMMVDRNEKEEAVYVHRFNSLMEMHGYYIYYEKNPLMQEYMISRRKESALPPSETYEDRATKNFRDIIKNKEEERKRVSVKQFKISGVAGLVAIVAIGLVSLNQYQTLENVGGSILSKVTSEDQIEETPQSIEVSEQLNLTVDKLKPVIESDDTIGDSDSEAGVLESEMVTLIEEKEESSQLVEGDIETNIIKEVEETNAQVDGYIEYKVVLGDNLVSICRAHYGSTKYLTEICEINEISTRDFIVEGQVIKLPEK